MAYIPIQVVPRTQNGKRIERFSEGLTRTKPEIKWVINEHTMWTEIYSRRQEIFMKVLGADKDKVRRNQTLGNIYNTYVMWLSSELRWTAVTFTICICHTGHGIYLTSITYYVLTHCFEDQEQIISCYFRLCNIYIHMECLRVINNMVSNECFSCDVSFFRSFSFIRYKNFKRPFRNVTLYNVLAWQGSSFCNKARLSFQAFALRDIKCRPEKVVAA